MMNPSRLSGVVLPTSIGNADASLDSPVFEGIREVSVLVALETGEYSAAGCGFPRWGLFPPACEISPQIK